MSDAQRRAARRAYLDEPTRAGVYRLRHLPSNRTLLAGSVNVDAALNRHRFELKLGHHRNRALQQDWQRDGADAFQVEVIDRVKPSTRPDFDPAAELQTLLALWRAELLPDAAHDGADSGQAQTGPTPTYSMQGCPP